MVVWSQRLILFLIVSPDNPIIMGEYQRQKVYIRRASYFKQRVAQKDTPLFSYIDIQNKICGYYIVLSNGKILKTKNLKVYKDIFEFEDGLTARIISVVEQRRPALIFRSKWKTIRFEQ